MTSVAGCRQLTWPAAPPRHSLYSRAAGSPALDEADGGGDASHPRQGAALPSFHSGAAPRGARRRPPPIAGGREATHGDAVPYRRARRGPACPASQRHPANTLPPLVPHLGCSPLPILLLRGAALNRTVSWEHTKRCHPPLPAASPTEPTVHRVAQHPCTKVHTLSPPRAPTRPSSLPPSIPPSPPRIPWLLTPAT